MARQAPRPIGWGSLMAWASSELPYSSHFSQDCCTALTCIIERLEHQHSGPFTHDKNRLRPPIERS